ncbi:MAG: ABC transporter permease [Bacilli bacterium]|nr:ABC transporter permease [Bacilli bacterium]
MKILNYLTIKHLKMNPKRTIVTIFGIILSMALMLGCGLLASSFIESMKEETIQKSGTYHVRFNALNSKEMAVIQNHLEVDNSYYYKTIGFAPFKDSKNEAKPFFYVIGANKGLLDKQALLEGRYPEKENEVVISDHIRSNGGKSIEVGDTITLDIGDRIIDGETVFSNMQYVSSDEEFVKVSEKEYQVVGVVKRSYIESYSAAGYTIFTYTDHYDNEEKNFLYVEYKKPKETFETTREIAKNLDLEDLDCQYNSSLLYYYGTTRYGNVNRTILSILCFALTLISIGCIIVIYNSFAISTMERKKQFGLYTSIGATRRQILHTVFFEAFVVGTIGIVFGILGAFLGIYTVIQVLNYLLKDVWSYHMHLVINWIFIVVPIIFMIVVIFFSALLPARRASKVSPIVAIRENDDIKMPKRKLWTPKWVTKFFGIEGELALKNMKRNKRKYRITVLSLFVSIVLFLTFSTYLTYGMATIRDYDYFDYDIGVSVSNGDFELLEKIRQDARVEDSYIYRDASLIYQINLDSYISEFANYFQTNELKTSNLNFIIMDDDDFLKLANRYHVSLQTPLLVNMGSIISYEDGDRYAYRGKVFQDGVSSLKICSFDDDTICDKSLENIQLINEVPKGFQYIMMDVSQTIFISKSHFSSLSLERNGSDEYMNRYAAMIIMASDYQSLYSDIEKNYKGSETYYHSPRISQKEQKNTMLAIKILLYGFISLVTLIGVTSVFNTIHTSINLRRKEFAMLRSMGLTPSGFNKMILFESLFFGLKSLFFGLPVSFLCMLYVHGTMNGFTTRDHIIIPWGAIVIAIIAVFVIILMSLHYSIQ